MRKLVEREKEAAWEDLRESEQGLKVFGFFVRRSLTLLTEQRSSRRSYQRAPMSAPSCLSREGWDSSRNAMESKEADLLKGCNVAFRCISAPLQRSKAFFRPPPLESFAFLSRYR